MIPAEFGLVLGMMYVNLNFNDTRLYQISQILLSSGIGTPFGNFSTLLQHQKVVKFICKQWNLVLCYAWVCVELNSKATLLYPISQIPLSSCFGTPFGHFSTHFNITRSPTVYVNIWIKPLWYGLNGWNWISKPLYWIRLPKFHLKPHIFTPCRHFSTRPDSVEMVVISLPRI